MAIPIFKNLWNIGSPGFPEAFPGNVVRFPIENVKFPLFLRVVSKYAGTFPGTPSVWSESCGSDAAGNDGEEGQTDYIGGDGEASSVTSGLDAKKSDLLVLRFGVFRWLVLPFWALVPFVGFAVWGSFLSSFSFSSLSVPSGFITS